MTRTASTFAITLMAFFCAIVPAWPQVQTVNAPQLVNLTQPLIYDTLPQGTVIDLSGYYLKATVPMSAMVIIRSPAATPSNPGPQNMFVTLRFGIIDGNGMATSIVRITETTDSTIEIAAAVNSASNCVILDGGNFMTANNHIRIGAIANCGGNGLLVQTATNSGSYNVQGNHIEVGQVINNGGSGIAVITGAWANTFIVGPVEHNVYFGCYDGSGGSGGYVNHWIVNGANSNGLGQVC